MAGSNAQEATSVHLLSVVGARPQFVKLAAISRVLPPHVKHSIIHTGQHYDYQMSELFFAQLDIPRPTVDLQVGSASHNTQIGLMLEKMQDVLQVAAPDFVLVYGDTNSTLAGAISSANLNIPIGHVEAGLRSHDFSMPEERNRKVADHFALLNFAPTSNAMNNLAGEGLSTTAYFSGDVVVDVLSLALRAIDASPQQSVTDKHREYLVATLHREALASNREKLSAVLEALQNASVHVIFPAHPRLRRVFVEWGIQEDQYSNISFREPFGFIDMVRLVRGSVGVVTDSGGLQKEAFLLKKPVLTIRRETEWIETLNSGWNRLCWDDLSLVSEDWWSERGVKESEFNPFGTPGAAERIISKTLETLEYR